MTGDGPPFDHDPTDTRALDPSTPMSFDEAKQVVDEGDADRLGFVMMGLPLLIGLVSTSSRKATP